MWNKLTQWFWSRSIPTQLVVLVFVAWMGSVVVFATFGDDFQRADAMLNWLSDMFGWMTTTAQNIVKNIR